MANLRKPLGNETGNEMNATMIARYLNGGRLSSSLSKNKIGKIMRFLNYEYKIKHNMMFYRVVLINGYDQQSHLDNKDQKEEKKDATFDNEMYLPF